jgi:hypothetical protein
LQYLASFAHDLPQPVEVKAGWKVRLMDRPLETIWCQFALYDKWRYLYIFSQPYFEFKAQFVS